MFPDNELIGIVRRDPIIKIFRAREENDESDSEQQNQPSLLIINLSKEKKMKRVLVIDGGGAKGIIPLTVLSKIEKNIDVPIDEKFDLIVGSSVGSIIGGVLASRSMSAARLLDKMKESLPEVFKKKLRIPILSPKYDRSVLTKILDYYIRNSMSMYICKTKFMCTSVNIVDGRTHFFKSWEEKDGNLGLVEAITRSYAAPLYFGAVVDNTGKNVWLDGGTGIDNCPLIKAYIEIKRQNWLNERVHILSLGCGYSKSGIPFNKAKRYQNIRQILFYNSPLEGGLARKQSANEQVMASEIYLANNPLHTFQRLDCEIPSKLDGMDKIQYINNYEVYGELLAEKVDYKLLEYCS